MNTPATFRYLFYPPAHYAYLSFPVLFDPHAQGFQRTNAAWAADLAMLAYAQDGVTPMGWQGVSDRLSAVAFSAQWPIGNWSGPGTQAFLAQHRELAVLAFRGTEPGDWTDVLLDLSLLPSAEQWQSGVPGRGTWRGLGAALTNGALVHGGFQRAFNTVWPQVEESLNRLPAGMPLLVCGHSLGGALAHLAVSRMSGRNLLPHLYTFGGPRTGNQVLGTRVQELTQGRIYRVVNEQDLVAAIPPAVAGYTHTLPVQYRLDAGGNVAPDEAEDSIGVTDVAEAMVSLQTLLTSGGNLDTPVPQPRLAAHSPVRYLSRLRR